MDSVFPRFSRTIHGFCLFLFAFSLSQHADGQRRFLFVFLLLLLFINGLLFEQNTETSFVHLFALTTFIAPFLCFVHSQASTRKC